MSHIEESSLQEKLYLLEREKLYDEYIRKHADLDKYLITVSTGTILLSITFIEKVVQFPTKQALIFMFFSWGALIFSLIFSILSYFWSLYVDRQNIANNDISSLKLKSFKNHYTHIAFTFLIVGITAMGVFSSLSLLNKNMTNNNGSIVSVTVEKTIELNKMPNNNSQIVVNLNEHKLEMTLIYDGDGWIFVEYKNLKGWIRKSDIVSIETSK